MRDSKAVNLLGGRGRGGLQIIIINPQTNKAPRPYMAMSTLIPKCLPYDTQYLSCELLLLSSV
jgi:hypothetical protein